MQEEMARVAKLRVSLCQADQAESLRTMAQRCLGKDPEGDFCPSEQEPDWKRKEGNAEFNSGMEKAIMF